MDDATLTWGFKESFRSYISGSIANGEWTVAGGATYETPSFGWPGGSGEFGDVAFEGSVRFTGHGDILDTTLADPRIAWSGTTGTLFLDISGTTQEGDPVDERGVEFATLELPEAAFDGVDVRIVDVAVTLTDAGAAAFGTYPAGEELDPLTLDLTLESVCAVRAEQGTPGWLWWILAGVAGLGIAGITVIALLRIGRRQANRAREVRSP